MRHRELQGKSSGLPIQAAKQFADKYIASRPIIEEWCGTDVIFEISEKGTATQIDFTHSGLIASFECYDDCKVGWTEHVTESLVNLINDGQGMPQ